MERHYGLDWLRIAAFGVLIFYHIGMVFVPWGFHVKTAEPAAWVAMPMMAANSWRLLLLFVVSGYASRALLMRSREGAGSFAWSRTLRLVIPLLFGVAVIIPIQPWVELTTQHGYPRSFAQFYVQDYFRMGALAGIILPTWNHLWFIAYLWVYSVALALAVPLLGRLPLQALFDRVFGRVTVWLLPAAWLIIVSAWLFPGIGPKNNLVDDLVAHVQYLPGFLFGFALAGSRPVMRAIARWWHLAGLTAIGAYGVVVAIEWQWPGSTMPAPYGVIFSAARAVQGWSAIIALIGLADRYLNRDHPWRPTLTEAVFPFYIIHQTIIVAVEGALLPLRLAAGVEFIILLASTIAGCWVFYAIGRRINWLRPLIGLKRLARSAPSPRPAMAG